MAAVVFQKLHSVVKYIVYFSNKRKISVPFMYFSEFVSVLMQYAGWSHYSRYKAIATIADDGFYLKPITLKLVLVEVVPTDTIVRV